jgi:hypothetical protein
VKNPIARANSMKAPKAQIAMFSELLIGKLPEIDTS